MLTWNVLIVNEKCDNSMLLDPNRRHKNADPQYELSLELAIVYKSGREQVVEHTGNMPNE